MATLTQQESATAEQLVVTDGTRKTFVTIIIAGIIVLVIGILAAIMGWGAAEHSEVANHVGATAHGAAAQDRKSVV